MQEYFTLDGKSDSAIQQMQEIIPQALVPIPLLPHERMLHRRHLRYLVNPNIRPQRHTPQITCEKIRSLSHRLVVAIHLYQDVDSPYLLKRIPPREAIRGMELLPRLIDSNGRCLCLLSF